MAKDPAFLFYYDRFLSGTYSMSDEQVGKYIRLMCIQANKGHVTEKDMLHICKSYDEEVYNKFHDIGESKFANPILTEVLTDRKNYTESRRTNRLGKKKHPNDNNISKDTSITYDKHMVNVDVNKDIDKEDIGKGVQGENQQREVVNSLMAYFHLNEQNHFNSMRTLWRFVETVDRDHGLEYFIQTFKDYQEYKKISKEPTHNFTGLIGTQAKEFTNSAWNSENWREKINNFNQNGKQRTTADQKQSDRHALGEQLRQAVKGYTNQ